MPKNLSPSVNVNEIDYSSVAPTMSNSIGGFVGVFEWGPVETPVLVSSETELVKKFGEPSVNINNAQSFLTAANFMAYSNNMYVTRMDTQYTVNAASLPVGSIPVSTGTPSNISMLSAGEGYVVSDAPTVTFSLPHVTVDGVRAEGVVTKTISGENITITGIAITKAGKGYLTTPAITISAPAAVGGERAIFRFTDFPLYGPNIKNDADYEAKMSAPGDILFGNWVAKYPGKRGNGLKVLMVDNGSYYYTGAGALSAETKKLWNRAPSSSAFARKHGIAHDEVCVVVYDTPDGTFSGVPNAKLEQFDFLSKLSDGKFADGSSSYYADYINKNSNYIRWLNHPKNYGITAPDGSINKSVQEPPTGNMIVNYPIDVSSPSDAYQQRAKLSFNAAAKTITVLLAGITDPGYAALNNMKTFLSGIPDTTRQMKITESASNNGYYPIKSIVFNEATPGGEIESATITTKTVVGGVTSGGANFTDETDATAVIILAQKWPWGASYKSFENDHTGRGKYMALLYLPIYDSLDGGTMNYGVNNSMLQTSYLKYKNVIDYPISLIPAGNVSMDTAKWIVDNVVSYRKDCVLFVSPNSAGQPIMGNATDPVADILLYRNNNETLVDSNITIDSSYVVMDSGFKYQYNRYTDTFIWVPLNGDTAGLCAYTDTIEGPWASPAGYNRGHIKNLVKLAFNPDQAQQELLYVNGVNPVVAFKSNGAILYGDKTLQVEASAFDRINVRRLFISLEKIIAEAAKYQLFEINDDFTRAQFKNLVEPYLRDIQGKRGIYDFRVKCDEVNNTAEVIDRNEFVADIFIKPSRSINYITLNFIAARSSLNFSEIGA